MATFESVTPNLIVRDIDRSTAFYRDVLGFTVKLTVPDAHPFVFVWMEHGAVPVFLNDPKGVAEDNPGLAARDFGGTATLFFIVDDVDAYYGVVAPRAKVVMPLKTQFYGMREFAIEDPDSHVLTFAQRVQSA